MTLMGWLLCKHWDDETQSRELWHIINSELLPSVTKRDVFSAITRIAFIAVNLNQKLLRNVPENDQVRRAKEYHKRIDKNRKVFLKKVGDSLPDIIIEESLNSDLLRQFYRSYDLRVAMAGDSIASP